MPKDYIGTNINILPVNHLDGKLNKIFPTLMNPFQVEVRPLI